MDGRDILNESSQQTTNAFWKSGKKRGRKHFGSVDKTEIYMRGLWTDAKLFPR